MLNLFILESFIDKPIVAGYSLRSIFEFWWIGLIVLIVIAIAAVATWFLLAMLFGRMKFKQEDQQSLDRYEEACKNAKMSKEEMANAGSNEAFQELKYQKKAEVVNAKAGLTKPAKNVVIWRKMAPWFIPVVCVGALLLAAGTSFLPSAAFANLIFTLGGSHVNIIDTETSRAAAAEAEKNVVTIQEEGTVLLKNNGALPINLSQNNKVNIFGSCAYGLFYGNGGSGSFQTDGRVKGFPRTALKLEVAMKDEGFEINPNLMNMIKNYYKNKSISVAESNYDIQCGFNKYTYPEIVDSKAPYDYEPPASAYTTKLDALGGKTLLEDALEYSDTAIFCITRRGSEDEDMNIQDLQLKPNEKACIEMLETNFEKVIILLNVPTVIESKFLDDNEIDSAVFMGHPGLTGTKGVAEVLCGKVNPSGHLVDTWPYDVKSAPSYQNFGNDTTLTYKSGAAKEAKFTNYIENIYVGYRYYSTRGMVDPDYVYEDEVQYSFGHGLSYTTFDKSIVESQIDTKNQKVSLTVAVKNTGAVAGKDVIQIYTHAPYVTGGAEKAWFSLTDFQKTNLIEPDETKNYRFEFTFRDFASWSSDKGCYILDKGEYEFSLRENVWDLAETSTNKENVVKYNLVNDIEFQQSYQTGKDYENIFEDVEFGGGDEKNTYLSRSDFKGTWQDTKDISTASASDASHFPGGASNTTSPNSFTSSNLEDYRFDGDAPEQDIPGDLTLRDLKDATFDDPRWEDLLSQMSYSDMDKLIEYGGFQTSAIDSIGKTATIDYDGPSAAFHSGTGHPSEVTLACSWSTEIAHLMGESIGREGAARGITGWYAPGINTHRSPFGGRNFEYYSEDPLIAGRMAGHTAQGALKYGVYSYAKHFILNEQENSRAGVFCWATEQAIREIYARGFEIYCDLGGIGIMSSFNCIGSWWAGGSEALLTTLLREEWGFQGVVVTDYAGSDYMATNIGLIAGNDLWLTPRQLNQVNKPSRIRSLLPHDGPFYTRRAAKNILYACAHSNNVWTIEDYEDVGIPEVIKASDGH